MNVRESLDFRGLFSAEARLNKQCMRALHDPDMASSLNRFRQVQQELLQNPREFAHLWIPFLEMYLHPTRVHALSDRDLSTVVEMGSTLSNLVGVKVRQEEVWLRVVQAYDARREYTQANALLGRIYSTPTIPETVKQHCARDLARRGVEGDEYFYIYVDSIRHSQKPNEEGALLNMLTRACNVDFTSPMARIRQARKVARSLAASNISVTSLQTALGLSSLLIKQDLSQAIRHFNQAFQENSKNRLALVGLLAASIQNRTYDAILDIAQSIQSTDTNLGSKGPISPRETQLRSKISSVRLVPLNARWDEYKRDVIVAALINLGITLQWLDSDTRDDPPPSHAKDLEGLKNLEVQRYVGDVMYFAIGRLYLVEGNAQQAAHILLPLAEKHPEQPRWSYYAAWAAMLVGDRAGLAHCFAALASWTGRWAVACLLLELDPALGECDDIERHLDAAAKDPATHRFASIIEARLAFARAASPPQVDLVIDAALPEESLEALRTALGCALYARNDENARKILYHPLFRRLPVADQLLWRGLHLILAGNKAQGRALLEEAAIKFGYRRAALALAVHVLEQHQFNQARQFLGTGAAGWGNGKVWLLRAYLDAQEGRPQSAAQQFEKLLVQGQPGAHYALGNLYLQRAAESHVNDQKDQAQFYREQAAGAFAAIYTMEQRSIPADCNALARVSAFVAHPGETAEVLGIWSELEYLDASRRRPWLIWYAALAQIWYGQPQEVADASEEILILLEHCPHLEEIAQIALAQAVARACTKAEYTGQAKSLVALLNHLSEDTASPALKRFARAGISATARIQYTHGSQQRHEQARRQVAQLALSDPGNGSLALLLASIDLEHERQEMALATLRDARPEDALAQDLCTAFAELLEGRAPSLGALSGTDQNIAPSIVQGYSLLRAMVAFAVGKMQEGSKALLEAMSQQTRDITGIVNIPSVLLSLCVHATHGSVAHADLAEMVRRGAQSVKDTTQAATVARCATVVGEREIACRLWEQAIAREADPGGPLHQEFAGFLCHLAVAAHKAGDDLEMLRRLRQANQTLEESLTNPGAQLTYLLRGHLHKWELRIATARLLANVFQSRIETGKFAGRYLFLGQVIEESPQLLQALLDDNLANLQHEWSKALSDHQSDIRFLHGLAVLYREQALASLVAGQQTSDLWLRSTVLWVLLLSTEDFWAYFSEARFTPEVSTRAQRRSLDDAEQTNLMKKLLRTLLSLHSSYASQNFAEHRYQQASVHLRCLDLCRRGEQALTEKIRSYGVSWIISLNKQKLEQVINQAEQHLDEWCLRLVQEAKKITSNAQAIDQLPQGIRQNYAGGIAHLEPFIQLDIPVLRILVASLGWYNAWCSDLYIAKNSKQIKELLLQVEPVIRQLISQSTKGLSYKRENQELSDHFAWRGFIAITADDLEKAIKEYEEALEWDPANPNAQQNLDDVILIRQLERAVVCAERKEFDEAYRILDAVEKKATDKEGVANVRASVYFRHAIALADERKFRAARLLAEQAQALQPQRLEIGEFITAMRILLSVQQTRNVLEVENVLRDLLENARRS